MLFFSFERSIKIKLGMGIADEIMMVNKFGKLYNYNLLLEYGISSIINLYCSYGNWASISLIGTFINYYIGPKIFLGFNKCYLNGFNISTGGFVDLNLKIYPLSTTYTSTIVDDIFTRYPTNSKTIIDNYNLTLSIGYEIRLNYSYIKKYGL